MARQLNMVGRGNQFNSTLMGANLREADIIRQTGCSHEAWGRGETAGLWEEKEGGEEC